MITISIKIVAIMIIAWVENRPRIVLSEVDTCASFYQPQTVTTHSTPQFPPFSSSLSFLPFFSLFLLLFCAALVVAKGKTARKYKNGRNQSHPHLCHHLYSIILFIILIKETKDKRCRTEWANWHICRFFTPARRTSHEWHWWWAWWSSRSSSVHRDDDDVDRNEKDDDDDDGELAVKCGVH